jgi:hypothetical protein
MVTNAGSKKRSLQEHRTGVMFPWQLDDCMYFKRNECTKLALLGLNVQSPIRRPERGFFAPHPIGSTGNDPQHYWEGISVLKAGMLGGMEHVYKCFATHGEIGSACVKYVISRNSFYFEKWRMNFRTFKDF